MEMQRETDAMRARQSADNRRPRSGAGQTQHDDNEEGRLGHVHGPGSWKHVDNSNRALQISRIPNALR